MRTGEQILLSARQMGPLIHGLRDEIERTRSLPEGLVRTMQPAAIFEMWKPHALGGPELSIEEFAQVIEALSYSDGSVGWCAGIAAAYSRFAGCMPERSARTIFDGNILAGSLLPNGRAVEVPGGFRVAGRWAWGSGIGHSTWIIAACLAYADDRPVVGDSGPQLRVAFLPKSDVDVVDTWNVGGLRGTGSHDFVVNDVFVPEEHTVPGLDPPPQHPASFYGLSVNSVFPFVIAAVPLGIARAAFDAFLGLAQVKAPVSGPTLLRDKPTVQALVGRSEALLRSSRELYYATARELAAASDPLTLPQRASVRLAAAQVGEAAKQVVRSLYDAAGGSAIYASCPLERHIRDLHAAAQHVQISPNNFEFAGRVLLGLDPGTARF